jgi:perosamine synthetase
MPEDFLPYSRQLISEEEVEAVIEALRSPIISQGAQLEAFEESFARYCQVDHAVGVSSGSAALHAMCSAAGLGPGDEVIVPALTFASSATGALHLGAKPVFIDVDPDTLCIDPGGVERAITDRTKAVLAVDFAGHPAPYGELREITDRHDLVLLADSAHSVGGSVRERPVGGLADITAFSFNPVKNMTAAEGGMVTSDSADVAGHVRMFRVHGMTKTPERLESPSPGGWYYEQQFLGFNYKLSELHAALGRVQLRRVDEFNRRRKAIAAEYSDRLGHLPIELPRSPSSGVHTWHLFVIRVEQRDLRKPLFDVLRTAGIGVQVHYIPAPMHPYFARLGYSMEGLDVSSDYYGRALSLPVHPAMTDRDVDRVVEAVQGFFDRV